LQEAFLQAGYYDAYWPARAQALSAYLKGDAKPLVELASPVTEAAAEEENTNAVYTAVECNDAPWPTDWATWDRDNTRLHRDHPFMTWANAWMNLPCATWPVKQQTPLNVKTGKGLPPVLIVQSERDAATPYEGAVELHQRFRGSRLITERDAGSHGVTGLVNPCI
ncbi:alpha/beta hydrolase, partial [Clavibacter michiganensis]|uniref:alpha/beta hydrolase n=1 Tax=Clavibacter michiganensis TaxID=28447 RepID=UPI00292EC9A3